MKYIKITIILLLLFSLSSCGKQTDKEEAYCFSMVFENINEAPTVTLYCKTASGNSSEQADLLDNCFSFSSDSYIDAMLSADEFTYEIYYNSAKAVYFSPDVKQSEIKQIILYFLDHAKYQSCVYMYTPENSADQSSEALHAAAKKVCSGEKIDYTDKKNYTFAVKALRNIYG